MGFNFALPNKSHCFKFRSLASFKVKPQKTDAEFHESTCKTSFNTNNFVDLLQRCINRQSLAEGKLVHVQIIKTGADATVLPLANSLLRMYGKCQSMEDSRHVFDKMQVRNIFSWNTLLEVFVKCGDIELAARVFSEMPTKNVFSVNIMIEGYAKWGDLEYARKLFDEMAQRNVSSWNIIIAGYVKKGFLGVARELFDKMPQRDVVSWNAMIAGYAKHGEGKEALILYWQMQNLSLGHDKYSLSSVLSVCAGLLDLEQGKQVHACVVKTGFESDAFVESALVDLYAKCRCIENAQQVFEEMYDRDIVSWTAMIAGYAGCGRTEDARQLFDRMPRRNVLSWNAMITGYAQNGYCEEALKLWCQMQRISVKMDAVTFVGFLSACASLAALEQGKQVHVHVIRSGIESDIFVGSALLDMYSKCGSIEEARRCFEEMPQRDVVSWNSMITSYGQNGYGKEALQIFGQMLEANINVNDITFISVLSACNHAGLVEEACYYFDLMSRVYVVTPRNEHYACMVDLLGRAGLLDKALDLINNMRIQPDASVWGALLGACRVHGNVPLGKHAAECVFKLEPENDGPYVLLSNIYSAAGMWEDAAKIRQLMKDKGITRNPGYSWIEVDSKVHTFYVGDGSNSEAVEV